MQSNFALYQDVPVYDRLTKYMLGAVIASTGIVGLVMLAFDLAGAIAMFGVTVIDGLIFWSIMPKRFEIQEHGFKIVLGGPFSMFIPFTEITRFRQVDSEDRLVFWGIKFATSSRYVIEVERKKGLNVIFSPLRGSEFLEELQRSKDQYREPDLSVFENIFK